MYSSKNQAFLTDYLNNIPTSTKSTKNNGIKKSRITFNNKNRGLA